ncbi:hypothetical protein K7W03_16100 [Sphingobium sp. PNB]|uniref:hypothetical protein n=1 Tax=Sphingobium sp. PNB TaxID=863934 RepID=UPI001CA4359F|nr:hypothetical protein [Sphingobium sp. PNB]MCB4861114.1 hypothetical protein [Sphingobium sp. PNB]
MHEVTTSRRDVMRALAIVPAAIAAPAVANAATFTSGGVSSGMSQAIAAYHNAVATENAWGERVYDVAWKACKAEQEAIPHLTTKARVDLTAPGVLTQLSTDNPLHLSAIRMHKSLTQDGARLGGDPERAFDEFLEKLEQREAEKQRIAQRHNMDALSAEQNRLEQASYAAMRAAEEFPVTTVADLIAKIQFSQETDGQIDHDDMLADLRRIAGRAAA